MNKMQHKFSWQTPNWLRVLCLTLLVSVTSIGAYAQTIATTLANNNGSGVVIGNLYNSNAFPILINTVHCAISTATTQNFQLWTKAVAGPNVGAPGAVSAANGWTLQATQSVTSTAATSTALTGTACPVVLSGLNVSLDANTYYLICIGATSINYSTIGTQTCSFTSGGVTLTYCTSNGYGGTFAAPGNTPRGLVGAITFSPAVACSGTPTPGNTLASATSACPSVPVTFSLQNNSGTGVTYQWYNNSGAISGATNATYITTITATDDYYCDVTCTSSGLTASSSLVNVTPNSFFNCYCPSSATSAADEEISNVTFGTLNNTSGCATLAPGPGSVVSMYSNYKSGTGAPTPPIVSQLQTVPFSVTQTSCGGNYTNVTGIYIDFNQNGSFTDAGENVFTSVPSVGSHIDAGNILIPLTASVGLTAMRIVNVESSVVSPCGTYTWGETEDYLIDIVATTACTGTPTPGNTVASQNPVCPNTNVVLTLSTPPVSTGNTFQWYNNSGPIPGATNDSYTALNVTAADDYYCDVTCTNSGLTASSNILGLTMNSFLNCYCAANSSFGTSGLFYGVISNVTFNTLNNSTSAPTASPYYTNYTPLGTSVDQGSPYPLSVTLPQYGQAGVWFDWDQNGIFDASEFTFMGNNGVAAPATYTQLINVPVTAVGGVTRMRVRSEAYFYANLVGTQACGNTNYGETEDYEITVVIPTPCTGAPAPGNTTASATSVCPGTVVNFGIANSNNGTGISYQWYNNSGAIAGATNAFYSQAITAVDDFWCDLTCVNSGLTTSSNMIGIGLNPFLNCYCVSNATTTADEEIYNVTVGSLNNTSTCASTGGPGSLINQYSDYTTVVAAASLTQLQTVPFSVQVGTCGGNFSSGIAIFIDYDHNGIFDVPAERVYSSTALINGPFIQTGSFIVPLTAMTGITRMRVVNIEQTALPVPSACAVYGYGETEDYLVDIAATSACLGAPTPGNTLASQNPVCPNTNVVLSLSNSPVTTGNTFQWFNNSGAIAGATDATYTALNVTAADDYYCEVTCTTSGLMTSSSIVSLTMNSFLNCYCAPNSSFGTSGLFYGVISNVTLNGINNSTSAPTVSPYYTNYAPGAGTTTTLVAGDTYPCSTTMPQYGQSAVWFDWNQNGLFGDTPDEFVFMGNNGVNVSATFTQLVTVPVTALAGTTKMRVRSEAYFYSNLLITQSCGNTNYGESEDYEITVAIPTPCSGTPAPGATLASASTVCSGGTINFSLTNGNLGTGISYQWYNNAGAIAGATTAFYSQVITASDAVYCDVTCSNSSTTASSTPVAVGLSPFYNCYCASVPTQTADEEIYQVTLNGASTNPLYANANGCATVAPGPGSVLSKYSNFTTLGNLTTITQGNTVTFEVRENECDGATYYNNGIGIWIDFNQNGVFTDAGEAVYIEATTSAATGLSPAGDKVITGSFVVPVGATLGSTTMRVISAEGVSGAGLVPCLQYGYGETEDHLIEIAPAFACSGTPAPGNTIASVTSACPNTSVNFSIQNNVGSGVTYQWFNNSGAVAGATNATYTQVMTAADNVYCDVTCTNSSLTAGSTPVAISIAPFFNCYCVTGLGGSCGINAMSSVDIATTTLNNVTSGCTGPYNAFPASGSTTATIIPGIAYTMNVGVISGSNTQVAIWIDENQNGVYETSEYTLINGNIPSGGSGSGTFTVPVTALSGNTGMRVRSDWQGTTPWTSADACTNRTWGETEDYVITIVTPTACSGTPASSNTLASLNPACVGNTTNLSLSTVYTESGITYQWYNGAGAIAGATNATYVATITAADNFYCDITCTNSSVTTSSTPVSITLNTFINCYCAAGATTGCANGDEYVGNFTLNTINNSSTCGTSTYSSYTTISTNLAQGQSYTASVLIPNWFGGDQASVWIDFNQDGTLDDITERFDLLNGGGSGTTPLDGTITVPVTALTGPTLCRVRGAFTGTYTACGNTSFGEVEDYVVVIDPVATNTVVSLNLFIEGFWDGSSAMLPVLTNQGLPNPTTDCDDITVELYNSAVVSPIPAPDYTTAAMLHTDGTATATFTSAITGNYYIVIKHRNALQTWSAAPVAMGPAVSYNFTTAASQAYGSNQVEIATGVFALYSGDVAIDENMDLLDLGLVETDISNFGFGYLPTDLNGDGNVDLLDSPIVETNISNFIFSSHP